MSVCHRLFDLSHWVMPHLMTLGGCGSSKNRLENQYMLVGFLQLLIFAVSISWLWVSGLAMYHVPQHLFWNNQFVPAEVKSDNNLAFALGTWSGLSYCCCLHSVPVLILLYFFQRGDWGDFLRVLQWGPVLCFINWTAFQVFLLVCHHNLDDVWLLVQKLLHLL